MSRTKIAIFPGSFDPLTRGHMEIISRAYKLFPQLHILVAQSTEKKPLFSTEERVELIRKSLNGMNEVVVASTNGLLVDYAQKIGATVLIRGLRAVSDFEMEAALSAMNARLWSELETVLLISRGPEAFISSRLVKEVFSFGGNVTSFVPEPVAEALAKLTNRSS